MTRNMTTVCRSWASHLLNPFRRHAQAPIRNRSGDRTRPRVEALEDRTVPSLTVGLTGTTVTLDETAGLQNDDTSAALLAAFSDRLTALGAAPATAIDRAVSGGNVISISGATGAITDLAFTDASGNALAGAPSGLSTTAGEAISLYTDVVNDSILLGKTPAGAIAFAVFVEATGSPVSGGKLWSIEYKALQHPDATNPDDSLSLPVNVKVTETQEINFGFAGAPSGSNLFMTFGNPSSTQIVVIGKDPLNQSQGGNITTKDVLNISQAGSTTSFGVNGNQINPAEGAFITYVSGTNTNFLVPNLDQNEADVEANIDFQNVVDASAASFTVNQTNPGVGPVTVRIRAFHTAAEPKGGYVDGLTNDSQVNITSASVVDFAVKSGKTQFTPVATVNADGSLTVTGLSTGDQVRWATSGTHNRVLIENVSHADGISGNDNNTFDIGGFGISTPSAASAVAGTSVHFEDDGPGVTAGGAVPALVTGDTDTPGDADATSFAGAFAVGYGADGPAAAGALTYALGVKSAGADSGLDDTLTGDNILLRLNGAVVEGYLANHTGTLAFTVAVAANGTVTQTQLRAVVHDDPADPVESGASAAKLAAADLVTLTATAKDGDGDTSGGTANIGQAFAFEDDGPGVTLALNGTPALPVDETALGTPASAPAATLFATTADFGADGAAAAGSSAWSLAVSADGADSGLDDTATGSNVLLFQSGPTAVVGKVGSAAGAVAFTVAIDAAGAVTLTQARALKHPDATDPDDVLAMASGLISAARTVTDGDGDQDAKSTSISQTLKFKDDGPTIAVSDSSGTFALGAQGTWSNLPGADGFKSLSVTLNSYAIGGGSAVTVNTSLGTATATDASGNYDFQGSITADFTADGVANAQTVNFTLTFNPSTGSYTLQLTTPPSTVSTFDTSQGSLAAGGPDAVQTLLFGGSAAGADDIVFFGAVATAPAAGVAGASNDLLDLVVSGEADLTESQIEGLFPIPTLINASTQMNVSTAGIGVNNNNLNGAAEGPGTGAFAGTTITPGDESFVVNPEAVVDAVTVFIDNSVGGYSPATEDLYFTIYFTDGTVSAPAKVTAGMLHPVTSGVAAGGVSFDIDGGAKRIDAVQLTMGAGTIKIPVIRFTVEQVFTPQPLNLSFTATLTDGDGDSHQDSFAVALSSGASAFAAGGSALDSGGGKAALAAPIPVATVAPLDLAGPTVPVAVTPAVPARSLPATAPMNEAAVAAPAARLATSPAGRLAADWLAATDLDLTPIAVDRPAGRRLR